MRLFFAAVFLLAAGFAFAHSDPMGEVHPRVTANQDGSFTVTFRYSDGYQEGRMRMMMGADGKERVPRHWIKKGAEEESRELPTKESPHIRYVEVNKEGAKSRALLTRQVDDRGAEKITARVLPVKRPADSTAATETAGKEVAFAYGELDLGGEGMPFKLTWCRSEGFQAARTVSLGTVACIYDFPSASPLVWSAGRWWVAWVRGQKKEDTFTWTTVLSSVDAVSGKVEHHDLPGNSNWNTSLAIAVNAAGTFCVAWHASVDGTYPGKAKIVTAVFTPEK
jgi:hypothetical protein